MHPHRRSLLLIHLCVFLWGFTSILGKLITLPAPELVWWRMLLVTAAIALLPRAWRTLREIPPRSIAIFAAIGVVIAMHWLAFYTAVKLANASVAATTMALAPVVTVLIEPAVTGVRFERHNLVLGILVIPGVALVMGGIPDSMHSGFWIGVASAALAAVFGALNKRFVCHHDAVAVTGIELGAGFLALTAIAALTAADGSWLVLPSARDGAWLLVLAILCTLVPFALSLTTLRQLSAFTIQLAVTLEPLYAIALAVLFLGEARELDGRFFAGVAIVLAAVLGHAWQQSRHRLRTESLTDEPRSV